MGLAYITNTSKGHSTHCKSTLKCSLTKFECRQYTKNTKVFILFNFMQLQLSNSELVKTSL